MTRQTDLTVPSSEQLMSEESATISTPSSEVEHETDPSMESQLGTEQENRALQFAQSTTALRAESRQAQIDEHHGELNRAPSASPPRAATNSRAFQVKKDAVTPPEMSSSSQLHRFADEAGLLQFTTAGTEHPKNIEPPGEDEKMTDARPSGLPRPAATASVSPDKKDILEKLNVNNITDGATTQFISIFHIATGASVAEARLYASRTNCNIPEAVQLYVADKLTKSEEQVSNTLGEEPAEDRPATLLNQALDAAKPRRVQKDGDLVIILEATDLSKTYRLHSEYVASTSPVLRRLLSQQATGVSARGIKYLFILQKSSAEDGMPWLQPKELNIMPTDCEGDFYKKPDMAKEDSVLQKSPSGEAAAGKFESEEDVDMEGTPQIKNIPKPDAAVQPNADWLAAYEVFIRIIARIEIGNFGISKTDIDAAVDKIELVAHIAKSTDTVRLVSSALDSVISNFIPDQRLWASIAKDASRWLCIGINLEKALIYNEAFVHVAGRYPEWPWSVPMESIPHEVLVAITAKSVALDLARRDIERKLLLKSFIRKVKKPRSTVMVTAPVGHKHNFAEFSIISIFRDWLAYHLDCVDSGKQTEVLRNVTYHLCDHTTGECITYAGLLRIISKGGDSYLPVDWLLNSHWSRNECRIDAADEAKIRACLKDLKTHASELVAPLLASTLKFEGRDELPYLTAVQVSEEDMPWDTMAKGERDFDDDESDDF